MAMQTVSEAELLDCAATDNQIKSTPWRHDDDEHKNYDIVCLCVCDSTDGQCIIHLACYKRRHSDMYWISLVQHEQHLYSRKHSNVDGERQQLRREKQVCGCSFKREARRTNPGLDMESATQMMCFVCHPQLWIVNERGLNIAKVKFGDRQTEDQNNRKKKKKKKKVGLETRLKGGGTAATVQQYNASNRFLSCLPFWRAHLYVQTTANDLFLQNQI